MAEPTELLEKMEEAGHGGHGHGKGGPGKQIGITMAILGVMLAFCAAMVGSARTELIATMVEQSNKWGVYQAEAMKYRVMAADLEMLHAITPSAEELNKFETNLKTVRAVSGRGDDEDTQELKAAIELATRELADVLTPDKEDEDHFKRLSAHYEHDLKEAKEDAECYEPAIKAHSDAAEGYEHAQLAAEVGIVIASIALLLGSRRVWLVAVVLGLGCAGTIAYTYVDTRARLTAALHQIEEAQKKEPFIEAPAGAEEAAPHETAPAPKGSASGVPAKPDRL
jgi:Domain of unknown function (DUF4337)